MSTKLMDTFLENGALIGSAPGRVLLGWGASRAATHPSPTAPFSFFCGDYFLTNPTPWVIYDHCEEVPIEELLASAGSDLPSESLPLPWTPPKKNDFERALDDLQQRFAARTLRKAVPYLFETAQATFTKHRFQKTLRQLLLCSQQQPIHLYGFWGHGHGIIGGTPELLFSMAPNGENQLISTVACAGTSPKGEGGALVGDPKQCYEHALVVEGIVKSLEPFGPVRQGSMTVLELGSLCHLVIPIEAETHGRVDFGKVLEALHPTPALGAYPKEIGMEWTRSYQQQVDRGRHGAPVGFFPRRLADLCLLCGYSERTMVAAEIRYWRRLRHRPPKSTLRPNGPNCC